MTESRIEPSPDLAVPGSVETLDKLEEASQPEPAKRKSSKRLFIAIALILIILAAAGATIGALIATNVIDIGNGDGTSAESSTSVDGEPNSTSDSDDGSSSSGEDGDADPSLEQECTAAEDIPDDVRETILDPTSWLDTKDFNCTFTDVTVGDLPVVGLFSNWNDSARANPNVPPLNEEWGSYVDHPARGVNLGGWLSVEPFITPSLFDYDSDAGVVDEWTLCKHLGKEKAAQVLEEHYSTFITEKDFQEIVGAGLDHLRIPFSYWAVETYDDDPYVHGVSWRYLLRAIEWARKYGLRVKLDIHGLPGSQNGWNHSGKQGAIGWLNGTDGMKNGERTLEIHDRLSKFFAQDRYKNVIVFYGLGNEPGFKLDQDDVMDWTEKAYRIVEDNSITAPQVFSEGIQGLTSWQGKLTGYGDSLVIDAHQYLIFSRLISRTHTEKIEFACGSFMEQSRLSMDTSTGFGPTMVAEWSQADTDCAMYLNGVGSGTRWEGDYSGTGSPMCPTEDDRCSCAKANEHPSEYSDDYKLYLKTLAIAQMDAFEASWGWFYWTWKAADSAAQWSYKHGLEHGYMPEKAYERDWSCSDELPDFGNLPEWY